LSGSGSRTTDDSRSRLAGLLKAGYAMLDDPSDRDRPQDRLTHARDRRQGSGQNALAEMLNGHDDTPGP
jgi:hypothetical protein